MESGVGNCDRVGVTDELTYFCSSIFSDCNNMGPVNIDATTGLNTGGQGIECWNPSSSNANSGACQSNQWKCSVRI